ncbi:hypothetical protein [Methylobacter marinus]|uniref:hypothetical protein n=1 Tax=Methylobacter marinus TaxID=34058 RepID=UPI000365C03D
MVKYEFKGIEAIDGFSMGLGGIAGGQCEDDVANSFQLPGFVRLDAMAAYKWALG